MARLSVLLMAFLKLNTIAISPYYSICCDICEFDGARCQKREHES